MTMEIMVEMAISLGLIAATSVLFAIVFLTYLRMRNRKMLLFSLGFGALFFGALLRLPQILIEGYTSIVTENVLLLLQLVGLIFIVIGILKD
jgi:hypothetical protein